MISTVYLCYTVGANITGPVLVSHDQFSYNNGPTLHTLYFLFVVFRAKIFMGFSHFFTDFCFDHSKARTVTFFIV